jgi:transcriptional regulator with XRE-family HTH domain
MLARPGKQGGTAGCETAETRRTGTRDRATDGRRASRRGGVGGEGTPVQMPRDIAAYLAHLVGPAGERALIARRRYRRCPAHYGYAEHEPGVPGQDRQGAVSDRVWDRMTNQAAGENPLRVFGAMLGYYRRRAGWTPEQLGARVYLSGSQIRKVEAGARTPTEDLTKACETIPELECNGALTELFEILSEHLRRRAYPGWFAGWPDREAQARRLRWFEPLVVPGLLQTERYARAILSTRMGATEEELDEAVAGRMDRQRVLGRDHPPELWAILDEAVLRRPVGGAEIMREQLARLTEAARRPNVAIQVIPFAAGAHEGLRGGAFIVADFDDAATVAYQDAASSGQILEDAAGVQALAVTWDTLRLDALPRAASVSLIASLAEAV